MTENTLSITKQFFFGMTRRTDYRENIEMKKGCKNRILVTTKHTKIITKSYISILLEFNCITHFDMCCTD